MELSFWKVNFSTKLTIKEEVTFHKILGLSTLIVRFQSITGKNLLQNIKIITFLNSTNRQNLHRESITVFDFKLENFWYVNDLFASFHILINIYNPIWKLFKNLTRQMNMH